MATTERRVLSSSEDGTSSIYNGNIISSKGSEAVWTDLDCGDGINSRTLADTALDKDTQDPLSMLHLNRNRQVVINNDKPTDPRPCGRMGSSVDPVKPSQAMVSPNSNGGGKYFGDSQATLPTLPDDSFHSVDSFPEGGSVADGKTTASRMMSSPRRTSFLYSVNPLSPQEAIAYMQNMAIPTMAHLFSKTSGVSLLEETKKSMAYPKAKLHSAGVWRASLPSVVSRSTSEESSSSTSSSLSKDQQHFAYPKGARRRVSLPLSAQLRRAGLPSMPSVLLREKSADTLSTSTSRPSLVSRNRSEESFSSAKSFFTEGTPNIPLPSLPISIKVRRASLPSLVTRNSSDGSSSSAFGSRLPGSVGLRRASLPSIVCRSASTGSSTSTSSFLLEEKRRIAYPQATAHRRNSLPLLAPQAPGEECHSDALLEEKRAIAYPRKRRHSLPSGAMRSEDLQDSHQRDESNQGNAGARRHSMPVGPLNLNENEEEIEVEIVVEGEESKRGKDWATKEANRSPWSRRPTRRSSSSSQRPIQRRNSTGGMAKGLRRNSWVSFRRKSESNEPTTTPSQITRGLRNSGKTRRRSHGLSRSEGLNTQSDQAFARRPTKRGLRKGRSRRATFPMLLTAGAHSMSGPAPFLGSDVQEEEIVVEGYDDMELDIEYMEDISPLSYRYYDRPSTGCQANEESDSKPEDPSMCGAITTCLCMATIAISAIIVLLVKPTSLYGVVENVNNQQLFSREVGLDLFIGNLSDATWQYIQEDSGSPQAAAYGWLIEDPSFTLLPTWRHLQRYALATIFYSLQGHSSWSAESQSDLEWFSYAPECEWRSGHLSPCNSEGRYQRLVLNSLPNIHGSIPAEINLLSALKEIAITDTAGHTKITDLFPDELTELPGLEKIDFSGLKLENSTLPSSIGVLTSLKAIHLDGMNLMGTIPAELSKMTNLEWLILSDNRLSGTLPSSFSSLTSIDTMFMHQNQFEGSLPEEWSSLKQLHSLLLSDNDLTGTLPIKWGQSYSSLVYLTLGFNELSGTIPSEWGHMSSLLTLDVEGNYKLGGTVPREICTRYAVDRMHITADCDKIECCMYRKEEVIRVHNKFANSTRGGGNR